VSWKGDAEDPATGLAGPPPANECTLEGIATVASMASTVVVKVPAWFTAAAALRVARLKGVDHLLVLDRQQLAGSVSTAALAAAPGHQLVGALVVRHPAVVTPDTPVEEAWRLMDRHGLDCVPVVSGGLLLGLLHRQSDLARAS
jgi:CBS domain-containing protein